MLTYSIPEKEFKKRGYTFQKLYAANYKTYRKTLEGYKIWIWVKDKMIEINDWHEHTSKVIDFYLKYRDYTPEELTKSDYLKLQLNHKTGHIQLFDYEEYFKVFETGSWDNWIAKDYDSYSTIVLSKNNFQLIIDEIKTLQ